MRFEVIKTKQAQEEFGNLEVNQQKSLNDDYELIEKFGIEAVKSKPLGNKIFEIKTNNIRSLFVFKENQIIVIGLIFVKKTQKTPKEILKLAKKRFKEVL